MADISELRARNRHFASSGAHLRVPSPAFLTRQGLFVVSCVDPRTDPAAFFELDLGDALVARTVGGRVTPGVLADLAFLSYLVESRSPAGPWFEVVVVHHTECASVILAQPEVAALIAGRAGVDAGELAGRAVSQPERTVEEDVGLLLASGALSEHIPVSGWVYDVGRGEVRSVLRRESGSGTITAAERDRAPG